VRLRTREGASLIDDSYNANPDSVRAAIELLASFAAPRVLVLGDMGEVGSHGPEFHREVGAHARARGIESLYAMGTMTKETVAAFGAGARHFDDLGALLDALMPCLNAATTVLVKGSRFMRMERVVKSLTESEQGQAEGAH
jgi:UDP-N-acetylmuramoyl-tripeptide--D-alanyl-D-alanine ligase